MSFQSCVVLEMRWKLHCQVVATHLPIWKQTLDVEENEDLKMKKFFVLKDEKLFR